MRLARLWLAFLALSGPVAIAALPDGWADALLPEKSHEFGTVARGSKLKYAFRLVNTTSDDVHIATYRTHCGCTDVRIGATDIPPGTQTTIELTLDTTRFDGFKKSGITLVFDKPQYHQVDLTVTSFIRGELTMLPGVVDFQAVPRATASTRTIDLTYRGAQRDWGVMKLTTISEHVSAELREISRVPGASVQYQLTATLNPTAPAGHFRDEITLLTNDPKVPSIPISVNAEVQPALSVAPGVLNLGRLRPGQSVQKIVLVKGAKPFKLTGASSSRPDLKATAPLGEVKPFHTVNVTFTAPSQAGPYNATLEIATDLDGEPAARLTTFATVIP